MNTLTHQQRYEIISRGDTAYAQAFRFGVTSTGIFCRPGCPARTPKFENCVFFESSAAAKAANFRACKRCRPEEAAHQSSPIVSQLLAAIAASPDKTWTSAALKPLGISPSTAQRQFKKHFGMSFIQYAREQRLGRAAHALSRGQSVIQAQLEAGYDSPSGFRAAFAKTFGAAPIKAGAPPLLIDWLSTPIGPMLCVCDARHLYMLEFTTRKAMGRGFEKLRKTYGRAVVPGRSPITAQIEAELTAYFKGGLQHFQTPIAPTGTPFQEQVWAVLRAIPYGGSCAYSDLATMVGNDKAVRAVASSNARNTLALIIPCHRVIAKDGSLGGYAGGTDKKEWLLAHEAAHK